MVWADLGLVQPKFILQLLSERGKAFWGNRSLIWIDTLTEGTGAITSFTVSTSSQCNPNGFLCRSFLNRNMDEQSASPIRYEEFIGKACPKKQISKPFSLNFKICTLVSFFEEVAD